MTLDPTSTTDYPFIRYWGAMLGSDSAFIDAEVQAARSDGAPRLAVYRSTTTSGPRPWSTLDEVTNPATLSRLASVAEAASDQRAANRCNDLAAALVLGR